MRLTEDELKNITVDQAMAHVSEQVYQALAFVRQLHDAGLLKGYPDAYRRGMGEYAAHGLRLRWRDPNAIPEPVEDLNQTTGKTTWLQKLQIKKKPD